MTKLEPIKPIKRASPSEYEWMKETIRRLRNPLSPHTLYLTEQLSRIEAGLVGEMRVDRTLETLLMPSPSFIIPNFHSKTEYGAIYQVDTIVLTKKYALLIEVKHIKGHIEFLSNPNQLKRTWGDQINYFNCPLQQIERNAHFLENLIRSKFPTLPIKNVLIFSHSNSRVTFVQSEIKIIYRSQLENYINSMNALSDQVDRTQLNQLHRLLLKLNSNFNSEALTTRYNINPQLLQKGVFCKVCSDRLIFRHPYYRCEICHTHDSHAVSRSIQMLFGILGHQLQLRTIKDHLDLPKKHMIIAAMRKLPVERIGHTKKSYYCWNGRI